MPRADLHARGKVRDIFEAGDDLLMVATDRISAFDVVLPQAIPDKGRVLTGLSLYWFDRTSHLVANHLITADVAKFPEPSAPDREWLAGRAMLVRRADVVPIECVARRYLSGSGWKEYRQSGRVCGVGLPKGLVESDRLPEPIFTPATKEATGHDINISLHETAERVGRGLAGRQRVGPRTAPSGPPRRGDRADGGPLPRGLRADHRRAVRRLPGTDGGGWRVKFRFEVVVALKEGLLDPQGKTIQDALPTLGWRNVSEVRVGKHIELVVESDDEAAAREQVAEMARRFLSNPVIEDFRILTGEEAAR